MMNDRARLWSKRKSAPFADPRDEERALREMRKSIDHSFNFNIDFKGEQPYMDNYRATVSFGAGCWQNTGTRRRADVPQQQERQHSILVSRQGLHSGLAMLVVAVCLFVMGVFWLNLQSQIQNVSTQIGVRTTNINAKQQENDTLQAQISVATKEQSLLQRAQKLGVPAAKYRTPEDVMQGDHERARGLFEPVTLQSGRELELLYAPFQFHCSPQRARSAVPELGEMTEDML